LHEFHISLSTLHQADSDALACAEILIQLANKLHPNSDISNTLYMYFALNSEPPSQINTTISKEATPTSNRRA